MLAARAGRLGLDHGREVRPGDGNAPPEVVWKSNRLNSSYTSPVARLDRVYAVNGTGVLNCADLANGKTVRWGNADDSARKAAVLAALMTRPGKVYDVSSPDLPTVS